ncbi:hypothetical protein [Mycolicibacterium sp.]|uniref:hypothetical protein n=1 Tax=Mycolicibacterium sp. TaxID=2320850 RepID=UPI0028B23CBE|nr:hypothetical protein [Mycolicibacterium sp.]
MPNRFLTGGLLAVGVMLSVAPAALAEPVPNPDPVPAPTPGSIGGQGGCQGGEVMQDGNCVPNMTPVTTDEDSEAAFPEAPLRLTDEHTSTSQSGVPVDLVPNLNGTPCTGYWMSGACYAERFNSGPAVIPKSTLSDSP